MSGASFWSRFKSVEDRLVFLASHRGALMSSSRKLLDAGRPDEALRLLESDPLSPSDEDDLPERPAYYVLSVPNGLYMADTLPGLVVEIIKHRMNHVWYEWRWRD